MKTPFALLFLALSLTACDDSDESPKPKWTPDGGSQADASDAGSSDAGSSDGSASDGSASDGGSSQSTQRCGDNRDCDYYMRSPDYRCDHSHDDSPSQSNGVCVKRRDLNHDGQLDDCTYADDCDEGYDCDHSNDESEDQSEGICVEYEEDGGIEYRDGGSEGPSCSDVCEEMRIDCRDDCPGGEIESLCLSKCTSQTVNALNEIDYCTDAIEFLGLTSACRDDGPSCFDVCLELMNCTCAASNLYSTCNSKCGGSVSADALDYADCDDAIALLGMTIACTPSSNRGSGKACTANGSSGYCMSTDWCSEFPDTKSVSGTCTDEASNVQCCIEQYGDDFPCKYEDGYCSNSRCPGATAKNQCPGQGTCCLYEDAD